MRQAPRAAGFPGARAVGCRLSFGVSDVPPDPGSDLCKLCILPAPAASESFSHLEAGAVGGGEGCSVNCPRPWPNSSGAIHRVPERREIWRRWAALIPAASRNPARSPDGFSSRSPRRAPMKALRSLLRGARSSAYTRPHDRGEDAAQAQGREGHLIVRCHSPHAACRVRRHKAARRYTLGIETKDSSPPFFPGRMVWPLERPRVSSGEPGSDAAL